MPEIETPNTQKIDKASTQIIVVIIIVKFWFVTLINS